MDIAGRRILLLVPMLAMIIDLAVLTACLLTQVMYFLPRDARSAMHGIAVVSRPSVRLSVRL